MPSENPREIALNVLQDVTRGGAYASLALSSRLRAVKLAPRDRALVSELVYGTLEKRITLDWAIDRLLTGEKNLDPLLRDVLRMGAYQILYLTRVPDSAACDESVKLARALRRETFTPLVNALLRNLSRQKEALPWPDPADDPILSLSVRHSLPAWICERLVAAYGAQEAEAIAAYDPEDRTLTLRATPDRLAPAAFEAMMTDKGWTFEKSFLEGVYRVSGAHDVGLDKDYLKGAFSVQGESSLLAAMAVSPKRAASVLDACAAPGGKTACLSEMLQGTGRVYAWDVHEHRVELIRGMVRRLHLDNVRPAVRDATVFREDLERALDAVLLDAPCSGLGVMLSKPDVKYRQTPEAVASLCEVQKSLLDTCCRYVKPGGTLVYSTCTILPEENIGQIRAFLAAHPDFAPDGEGLRRALPARFAALAEDGTMQLFAHRDGLEGFFIARLRRVR